MSHEGVHCETCCNRYFLGRVPRGCPYCAAERLRELLAKLIEAGDGLYCIPRSWPCVVCGRHDFPKGQVCPHCKASLQAIGLALFRPALDEAKEAL